MIQDEEVSNLKEAIKEMITNNQSFTEKVVSNLLFNYEKKLPKNNVLALHLFPGLRLKELLDLHEDFGREMEKVKVSYIEIGPVFKSFQDRFLVYCSVTSQTDLMREFLADQMASNEDIRSVQAISYSINITVNFQKSRGNSGERGYGGFC